MDDTVKLQTWQLRAVIGVLDGRLPGKFRNRTQACARIRRGLVRAGVTLPQVMAEAWKRQRLADFLGSDEFFILSGDEWWNKDNISEDDIFNVTDEEARNIGMTDDEVKEMLGDD